MIKLSLQEITTALNGQLIGDNRDITSVSTDSRNIEEACLFIALKGERFDAHDFADAAVDNGAMALLVSKPLKTDCPQVLVADTRIALGQLGAYVKQKLDVTAAAITGSNGKTSVKEMLAAILKQSHQVLYTAGNFNNDIGAPLTLLRLTEDDEYGVFELGANHKGEIDYTSNLVQPQVAVVNNVGQAHIEGFGSLDDVAVAKAEIYQHLTADGVAVINADDFYAPFFFEKTQHQNQLSFGITKTADVTATELVANRVGQYQFVLNYQNITEPVQLLLNGKHQVHNALAAASMALALGISITDIVQGLESMMPVSGRMQPYELEHLLLIDDSYNANPSSVKVAINWLSEQQSRRVLVLGDFAELGEASLALHQEIGEYAKAQQLDDVLTIGAMSHATSEQFGGQHYSSMEALISELKGLVNNQQSKITILVKGSRSAAMERVVNALTSAHERGELK